MSKAIFTTKVNPTYDDLPEERYHFPSNYLRRVETALGDWIVYYEPRRSSGDLLSKGGRSAYFATAYLTRIEADPVRSDHYYGFVEHYLEFDHPVSFKDGSHYFESSLKKPDGSTNKGNFGHAVRTLTDTEYDLILQAGFAHVLADDHIGQVVPLSSESKLPPHGFADTPQRVLEPENHHRNLLKQISTRTFRDRAFSVTIKNAYGKACAMSGLKTINGGGRSEVQAAHIRPVSQNGPDSVRNGLALSGTFHWMFDRGLISIDDDFSILLAKKSIPDTIMRLLNPDGKLRRPTRMQDRPHSQFLDFHRKEIFKG